MSRIELFESADHRNILLEDATEAGDPAVQANQHLVIHGDEAMILDPGGLRFYSRVLAATLRALGGARLRHVFLSHQDPDVVAAVNGWLMTTSADAHISVLWLRFVAHFGLDRLVLDRLHGIPDEGCTLELAGQPLHVLPAHFMHSAGNFHVFDPVSRILYTGDLGASLQDSEQRVVTDFDAHVPALVPFHQRYLPCRDVIRPWLRMVRELDVETIAPQHGAMLRGEAMVDRFLHWLETLEPGIAHLEYLYRAPGVVAVPAGRAPRDAR
ncbi:MAG: MBL fold metallo-hydrolase [Planctomycetes bacterium]|nr:MBL fold metallo-hydrolase [Planctomycetota bacterium]